MYCSSWQASHGSGILTSQSLPHNPHFSFTTLCNGPGELLAVIYVAWPQQLSETTEKQSVVSSILHPTTTCTTPPDWGASLGWTLNSLDHNRSRFCSCLCPCLPSAGIRVLLPPCPAWFFFLNHRHAMKTVRACATGFPLGRTKLGSYLWSCTEKNSRWMEGLNLKLETLELRDENIGLSATLGWVRTFRTEFS